MLGSWGTRFGVIKLICRLEEAEMPINVNRGGWAEVMLTQTLKKGEIGWLWDFMEAWNTTSACVNHA